MNDLYQRPDHSNRTLGEFGDAETKHSWTCTELKKDIDDFISEYEIFADGVSELGTGVTATNRQLESLRDELTGYVGS